MIPATIPYEALFTRKVGEHTTVRRQRVVAWDNDGEPLVASPKGPLVLARHLDGFEGVSAARYVFRTAIPGAGWKVRWNPADEDAFDELVLAWLITEDGEFYPVTADREGLPEVVGYEHGSTPYELVPPDQATHSAQREETERP